ncbi:MAG: SHOCT domain-containing protein [Anaerolineales bacterium]
MMGWSNAGNSMLGMGGFGGFIMVFFWVLIIIGTIMAVRSLTAGQISTSSLKNRDPLEILKERYTRGEIDTEEYASRRNALRD